MCHKVNQPMLPTQVKAIWMAYPDRAQLYLRKIRLRLLQLAARLEGVGPLTECIRWHEASYRTAATKSGLMLRLGWHPTRPAQVAIYFHCRSQMMVKLQRVYDNQIETLGNRAMVFDLNKPLPMDIIDDVLAMALTYYL